MKDKIEKAKKELSQLDIKLKRVRKKIDTINQKRSIINQKRDVLYEELDDLRAKRDPLNKELERDLCKLKKIHTYETETQYSGNIYYSQGSFINSKWEECKYCRREKPGSYKEFIDR